MGGNFGNKNQNQDADLIAASLAKNGRRARQAGALAQGRLHRHARPLADGSILQSRRHRTTAPSKPSNSAASAAWAAIARIPAPSAASRSLSAPISKPSLTPVYTNKTVSGNFRGPEFPQGYFGIQSMMDEVAYKMKMDPVDFALKNMTRKPTIKASTPTTPWTNASIAVRKPSSGRNAGGRSSGLRFRPDQARRRLCVHGLSLRRRPQQRGATRRFQWPLLRACWRHRRRRGRQDHYGPDRGRGAGRAAVEGRSGLGRHRNMPLLSRRIRQPDHHPDRLGRHRSRARFEKADR